MEEKKTEFIELLRSTKREGIEDLITWLETTDFYTAPASTKFHGNHETGLLIHSLYVYKVLAKMSKEFNQGIKEDEIIISSLLHDLCKANMYVTGSRNVKNEETGKWEKKAVYQIDNQEPIGHGAKSAIIAQRFIKLTDYELYSIIHHMGFPGGDSYGAQMDYNAALEKNPKILLLHLADNMSSSLFEKVVK